MRVHIPAAYECFQCGAPQGEYVFRNVSRPSQWASMEPKAGQWIMKKVVILQGGICATCAAANDKMVAAS